MAQQQISVLIVEDSAAMRELLVHIFTQDKSFRVIGTAADGLQAIDMTQRLRPDVITMDLHMPNVDGIEAVRRIMENTPTPIVIVSGSSEPAEVAETFHALEAGALAIVEKPTAPQHSRAREIADKLRQTVKLMSEVRVVRRWPKRAVAAPQVPPKPQAVKAVELIVIGASTGGPLVLQSILQKLGGKLSVPVVIVQHMANGFLQGFADWLAQSTGLRVALACDGEHLLPGRVYIAPENCHTEINAGLKVKLCDHAAENGHRPAVALLFRSAATNVGAAAIGVILSGMGRDGAAELKLLRERGAWTIAQSPDSTVVPGMPGEAIRLNAAAQVLPPEEIALELIKRMPPC